jgi:anti-sigma B factor antagonist
MRGKVVNLQLERARLETKVEEVSGVPIVRVAGEIDAFTTPELKTALNEAIESSTKGLIIDLTEVSYMDSSGFGALLGAAKRVKPQGGTIYLVGCSDTIKRILHITKLDIMFELLATVEEAITAIES